MSRDARDAAEACHGSRARSQSPSSMKTFWRMQLHEALTQQAVLAAIELNSAVPRLLVVPWEEYWGDTPRGIADSLRELGASWHSYVAGGANPSQAAPYCQAYLALVKEAVRGAVGAGRPEREFLGKVLGFENFALKFSRCGSPFAAGTTSFRNPAFLSFYALGLRKDARNDPSLLPLIVGCHEGVPQLFYHYSKQSLIRSTDQSLLFFPHVELRFRAESFRGLQALTGPLVSDWDSRIDERSRVLADKVLVPLLSASIPETRRGDGRALRVLDIGSGVGLLTSRVIGKIARSGVLAGRKIELSLLDILPVDPKRHFRSGALLPSLARVEYVSRDYLEWVNAASAGQLAGYDLVFLFRILHNMSLFRLGRVALKSAGSKLPGERYPVFPHLADYYLGIELLFPQLADERAADAAGDAVFHPRRIFNPAALLAADGSSLVERLARASNGVLIEDADLLPSALISHMSQHVRSSVRVFDLSRALGLSINHIYWITRSGNPAPLEGEELWPR